MYDMRIAIFTYSVNGTVTPHWTWIQPDPAISMKSSLKDRLAFKEMWLYHQDDVHYDLLVNRPLPEPSVYTYLPPVTDASRQPIKTTITEGILITDTDTSSHVPSFSPFAFMQCTRSIGRPKLKRFGAPSLLKSQRATNNNTSDGPSRRGRGRPKGAKNKPKHMDLPDPKRIRVESLTEKCNICLFRFDDPVKRDKQVTYCASCKNKVHKPCLEKDGCLSDSCFLLL